MANTGSGEIHIHGAPLEEGICSRGGSTVFQVAVIIKTGRARSQDGRALTKIPPVGAGL